jgi:hypothetical protein
MRYTDAVDSVQTYFMRGCVSEGKKVKKKGKAIPVTGHEGP